MLLPSLYDIANGIVEPKEGKTDYGHNPEDGTTRINFLHFRTWSVQQPECGFQGGVFFQNLAALVHVLHSPDVAVALQGAQIAAIDHTELFSRLDRDEGFAGADVLVEQLVQVCCIRPRPTPERCHEQPRNSVLLRQPLSILCEVHLAVVRQLLIAWTRDVHRMDDRRMAHLHALEIIELGIVERHGRGATAWTSGKEGREKSSRSAGFNAFEKSVQLC